MRTAAQIREEYWQRKITDRALQRETRTGWFWARREELARCTAWKIWKKK